MQRGSCGRFSKVGWPSSPHRACATQTTRAPVSEANPTKHGLSATRAAKIAIKQGIGIGFVASWDLAEDDDLVEVMAPLDEWAAPIWLVTHMDLHRTAKVQSFLRFLKSQVKQWGVTPA